MSADRDPRLDGEQTSLTAGGSDARQGPDGSRAGWRRQLLIVGFTIAASYGVRPIVSYRALELGANPFDLGLVVSAYAILASLAAMPIGGSVDRWGERPFIVVGSVGLSVAALGLLLAPTLFLLAVAHAAFGLALSLILVATQTMLANRASGAQRTRRFGTYFVVASLGQFVGPALAGVLAGFGSPERIGGSGQLVFLAAIGAGTIAALLGLKLPSSVSMRRSGARSPSSAGPLLASARTILRMPSMREAMISSITILASIDILSGYLPVFAQAHGLPIEVVGALLATRAAFSMVSRLFMAQVLERYGRRIVLSTGLLAAGLGMLVLPVAGALPALLFGAMALIGLGLGLGQPITISWVAALVPRNLRGTALGVRISGNRVTQLLAPPMAGAVASVAGVGAIYPMLALLLLVSAASVIKGRPGDDIDGDVVE